MTSAGFEWERTDRRTRRGLVLLHDPHLTGLWEGPREGPFGDRLLPMPTSSPPGKELTAAQPVLLEQNFFSIFIFFNMCKDKPRVRPYQTPENQRESPFSKATHHPEQGERRGAGGRRRGPGGSPRVHLATVPSPCCLMLRAGPGLGPAPMGLQ